MSRCRNFRALSINPWIFCLITFHGFYSLEPFGSIILRFIIFLLGHAGAVECPCKLLSCRSKQICLIVKTLTNNPQWSRDRYGRPTTWPNIFQCRNTTAGVRHSQIYEECLGVLSHCLALAYNYARTWKTNKTIFRIAVWFRQQDGQHFGILVWTFGLIFQEAKKCVEEVKTWAINSGWNFVWNDFIYIFDSQLQARL